MNLMVGGQLAKLIAPQMIRAADVAPPLAGASRTAKIA
jgi:hypothetical protein